ncbi:MAG: L-aspartate oxidase [Henriciella sp.]
MASYKLQTSRANDRVLIIGAGLAGLFLALRLAPRPCTLVSSTYLGQATSSAWAQGGLAAALGPGDSPDQHASDTIAAGAGLVDPAVARMIAHDGPARVRDLIALGVPFDRTPEGQLALSLEAAHSRPRVARVSGDLAGKAIMKALTLAVRSASHIQLIEHASASGLIQDQQGRIAGAVLKDSRGRPSLLASSETVLCMGGAGGLFRVTTNPARAQGEAMAFAASAGALIADPEFVQFHPTALDIGKDPAPLASEALRGDGATLINATNERFMARYHPDGELAPRDVVARAIHSEIAANRPVFLDTRSEIGDRIEHHFATIFQACIAAGIDPRQSAIPVAPAMHYHMGGVVSDLWGRSSLTGLSVCGECASTGAHGANRLASNSLLEAVVMAARIADRLRNTTARQTLSGYAEIPAEIPGQVLQQLRQGMSRNCGLVRNRQDLAALHEQIGAWQDQFGPAYTLEAAGLIVQGAITREESRGAHYRSDFPDAASQAARTFIHQAPFQSDHRESK